MEVVRLVNHMATAVSGLASIVTDRRFDESGANACAAARLAKSDEDLKRGRTFGPFNTAEEMISSMKGERR